MTQPLIAPNANDPREDGPSAGELSAKDRRINARTAELLNDYAWWADSLVGFNTLNETIDEQLPRAMMNLDAAIQQNNVSSIRHPAIEGLTTALSIIQREARHRARKQAEGECE